MLMCVAAWWERACFAAVAISSGVTGMSNFLGSVSTPLSAALTTILSALGAAVAAVAVAAAVAGALLLRAR